MPPGTETAAFDSARLDAVVPGLLSRYHVAGAGIGVIRDGRLVWDGYYGEQRAGVAASARTVFNTASVEKTVTAETLLALAAKGLIDLDEPIAGHVSEPDLERDPRYKLLTPRLLLSHRAGLLNWPYSYDDGRLAFVHDPGTRFSYSGAGVDLAARYAEKKLGRDFEALAFEHLLRPNGVEELSMGRLRPWLADRLATPMDAKGHYDTEGRLAPRLAKGTVGDWSAADDLLTTVEAYSRLLEGLIRSDWLTPELVAERARILTSLVGDPVWGCEPAPDVRCARAYGHGIGWMVYEYADKTVLIHGGNDAGENALVYYSPKTRSGAVILVNGGNGIFVTTHVLELVGDQPELAAYYRQLVKKHYGVTLAPIVEAR
ncbi:serine hydrolase domain-containing protein [Pyxidicoccus sp. 3LG]